MALIKTHRLEDFKKLVSKNCTSTSHVAVTDYATYVVMTPTVTSHHRHYIHLEPGDESTIKDAVEWLKREGYDVIEGEVEVKTC